MRPTTLFIGIALLAFAGSAVAETPKAGALIAAPQKPEALIAATQGEWRGELQYRDYQSNTWMGLPMQVAIVAQPDGVTTVRTARYDDGPQTGIVTITGVSLIDPKAATETYASFRKGRAVDSGSAAITSVAGTDMTHWTIVTTQKRIDGDAPAQVRETTTRDGDQMTTLKEVNPDGDGVDTWLPRNRTVLTRVTAGAAAR